MGFDLGLDEIFLNMLGESENQEQFIVGHPGANSFAQATRISATESKIRELIIDASIKQAALAKLYKIQSNHRTAFKQKSQNEVIFACVWAAYSYLDMPVDPKFVVSIITPPSPMGKAEGRKFRLSIDNAIAKYIQAFEIPSPERFVPFYLDRYFNEMKRVGRTSVSDPESYISQAMTFVNEVTKKCDENKAINEWLQCCTLTSAVIGILCFYITCIQEDKSFYMPAFENACYLTSVCINKYKNTFEERYNA